MQHYCFFFNNRWSLKQPQPRVILTKTAAPQFGGGLGRPVVPFSGGKYFSSRKNNEIIS